MMLLRTLSVITILVLSGCSSSQSGVTPVAPTPTLVSIQLGSAWHYTDPQHMRLSATAIYDNDDRQPVTSAVAWVSSDTSVATVSDAGLLTVVADGATVVTATYQNQVGSLNLSFPIE
jgi:16S rRNA C1402 (ribose-2'-O) methylase RsmI